MMVFDIESMRPGKLILLVCPIACSEALFPSTSMAQQFGLVRNLDCAPALEWSSSALSKDGLVLVGFSLNSYIGEFRWSLATYPIDGVVQPLAATWGSREGHLRPYTVTDANRDGTSFVGVAYPILSESRPGLGGRCYYVIRDGSFFLLDNPITGSTVWPDGFLMSLSRIYMSASGNRIAAVYVDYYDEERCFVWEYQQSTGTFVSSTVEAPANSEIIGVYGWSDDEQSLVMRVRTTTSYGWQWTYRAVYENGVVQPLGSPLDGMHDVTGGGYLGPSRYTVWGLPDTTQIVNAEGATVLELPRGIGTYPTYRSFFASADGRTLGMYVEHSSSLPDLIVWRYPFQTTINLRERIINRGLFPAIFRPVNIMGFTSEEAPRIIMTVRYAGGLNTGDVIFSLDDLCDPLDFNNDGVFPDAQDAEDYLAVLAGGPGACSTGVGNCNDLDFNNDAVTPDDADLAAFLRRLGGGSCDE